MTGGEGTVSGRELPIIYMNGSAIPLAGHELVAVLLSRSTVGMLFSITVLLALPSGGILLGNAPLWARLILNVALASVFLFLFPALLLYAKQRAADAGIGSIRLLMVSVPAAILAVLSTEALKIVLLDGNTSRSELLVKLAFGVVCFELVLFVLIWFYAPIIKTNQEVERDGEAEPETVAVGTLRIVPQELRRIETDGRHLHLHLDGDVQTVNARLRDVADKLSAYGLLVHRCHWVAFAEVGPIRVKGRSYEMTTRRGDSVPVARDRRKAVEMAQDGRDAA